MREEEEMYRKLPCLSLSACGFYCPYHVGVMEYVMEKCQRECFVLLATSAGVFVAIPFILGLSPLKIMLDYWPSFLEHMTKRRCGHFFDDVSFCEDLSW